MLPFGRAKITRPAQSELRSSFHKKSKTTAELRQAAALGLALVLALNILQAENAAPTGIVSVCY